MTGPRKFDRPITLHTSRLLLRPWRVADYAAFVEIDSDPRISEFYPRSRDREESAALVARMHATLEQNGFGMWAVEVPNEAELIGFIGLQTVPFEAHFTPALEVGWQLAHHAWGRGFATEGACAALTFGHDMLGHEEIVAMTSEFNVRSQRVMEKLAMTHDPRDDFDVPVIPAGHPLRRYVLYRHRPGPEKSGVEPPWRTASSADIPEPRPL
jgi:RimJ/RimL family protein N-acetyltransferase